MSRGPLSALSFTADEAVDLIENILEVSTEYSIVATDLAGTILLWNEGAPRHHGYEPVEIIGKSKSLLHPPDDVEAVVNRAPGNVSIRTALSCGSNKRVFGRRRW
jgi:hypothetical protein